MVTVINYEPEHAYKILGTQNDQLPMPKMDEWIKAWKELGPAFTMMDGDQVVGCGGVILSPYRSGEAWTFISPLIPTHKKAFLKACRNAVKTIARDYGLLRIQASVYSGHEKACHFIRHLGFKNETPEGMKKAGPNGEDMILFARTFEEGVI